VGVLLTPEESGVEQKSSNRKVGLYFPSEVNVRFLDELRLVEAKTAGSVFGIHLAYKN